MSASMHRLVRPAISAILLIALSACATIKPAPLSSEQDQARRAAAQALHEVDFGLTVIAGIRPMLAPLPQAVRQDVQCAVVRAVGYENASPADVQAAEKVCGTTLPKTAESPLAKATKELLAVTSCASLSATVATVRTYLDPLLAKLEGSSELQLRFAALSIRSGMAFVVTFKGGASCGSPA